jgi:hypothetical protein
MAKGRQAASSAEKSIGGIRAEIERYEPAELEDDDKGYVYEDEPRSEEAKEYLRKGKQVGYT